MTIWAYFRDHVRLILFFFIGIILVLSVILLDARNSGYTIPLTDAVYACALGLLWLVLYLIVEYSIRRPMYRELRARQHRQRFNETSTIPIQGTAEQRVWANFVEHSHQIYMRELSSIDEKRKFYELFLTRFAHQMKTPLTIIQLLEEELKKIPAHGKEINRKQELLNSLAEERERLDANLNLILQTARLASFAFDAYMEKIDIVGLLRSAVNDHKTAWIRQSLYPRIVCADEQVWVQSDRKWLLFVCDQFLRNALQYGVKPATTGSMPFIIQITRGHGTVSVALIDEGIGIPERDLHHVFDPFFTGVNGRAYSRATGMGLYLVKQVCDLLGHRVEVTSKENVGTTLTLIIEEPNYYAPLVPE